jgi:DNA invertase Pin-like site-specific DNA recombinase
MGELVGYARVSTIGQNLDSQIERLEVAGVTKLFVEKKSGLDGDRAELGHCLEYLREGDTLIVTKLDRLARSTAAALQDAQDARNRPDAARSRNHKAQVCHDR